MRGQLAALKDGWMEAEPPKNVIDFMNGFRHSLFEGGCLAKERFHISQEKMKWVYDRHSEYRELPPRAIQSWLWCVGGLFVPGEVY